MQFRRRNDTGVNNESREATVTLFISALIGFTRANVNYGQLFPLSMFLRDFCWLAPAT